MRIFSEGQIRTVSLQEPVLTAGSGAENDLVLAGANIPEVAIRLTQTDLGFSVTAANAKFKPLWNGKPCDQFMLKPGDLMEIGSSRLLLESEVQYSQSDTMGQKGAMPGINLTTVNHKNEISAGLSKLCLLVAEERDLKTLLSKVMHLLLETLGGKEALLFTVDGSGKPAIVVSTRPGDTKPLFSDTVVKEVLRTRNGIFLGNALSDPAYASSQSVVELKLHSVLCCPILAAGRLSGLIYIGSNVASVSFNENNLRELEVYALVVGCLINHVGYIEMQSRVLASLRAEAGELGFIATSPAMQRILSEAKALASGDISVLLEGETGTGKDVIANYIHRISRRSSKPFMVVNCSTLRGELLASELFGHKKGAFTGAFQDQKGLFQSADGGTLFLDEIGEMELPLQAMLLRTLESGMVRPVGQATEIRIDVRILCATNRKLEDMIAEGTFRQDLYYRINQHAITMPPLRERGEDIALLAHHFLEKAKSQYPDKQLAGFHPESLFAITRYRWPGNIRELGNAVYKAVLFTTTPVIRIALPENKERWMNMDEATRRFQMDYLQKALDLSGGDKDKAASLLGMGRSTFFRYLAQAKEAAQPQ
jgi:transcriptional regulator with GAF, ATPase, and Fis domain